MPRRFLVGLFALALPVISAAQTPPRRLPTSVTGRPDAPEGVTTVGGNQQVATPAPMERFLGKPGVYPPETEQAVLAVRLGTDWLHRMNKPGGRFLPGLNPAVRQSVATDTDFRQALATLALADGAHFTGDERFVARASGAVLALLSRTQIDDADATCRVPMGEGNRIGYAAVTALAIFRLPGADPKLRQDAARLMTFVRQQIGADAAIPVPTDPTEAALTSGFVLQALVASLQATPDDVSRAAFSKAMARQTQQLRATPTPLAIAATLPALVDYALLANKDAAVVGMAFEFADKLCAMQIDRVTPQHAGWIGGFAATAGAEPTAESAVYAQALCHAARLTRQIPDAARFTKYRTAAAGGLAYVRNLQFTDDSSEQFERSYRTHYLNGGVRLTPSDSTMRIDAAAFTVLAHLAFLECGTEQRLR